MGPITLWDPFFFVCPLIPKSTAKPPGCEPRTESYSPGICVASCSVHREPPGPFTARSSKTLSLSGNTSWLAHLCSRWFPSAKGAWGACNRAQLQGCSPRLPDRELFAPAEIHCLERLPGEGADFSLPRTAPISTR